jgi:hypothetical protein
MYFRVVCHQRSCECARLVEHQAEEGGRPVVSILLLYLQLFAVQRPFHLVIYFTLFFTIDLYITFILYNVYFKAPHIGESWDNLILNGYPNKAIP